MIDLDQLDFVGVGLKRPECVLATEAGSLFVSNRDGGVTRIDPDGSQRDILADPVLGLRPNGIALRRDGSFLLAHLGDDGGGVFLLSPDGACRPILTEVEGQALPPSNFVVEDNEARIWLTVSTRLSPRHLGYRRDHADGFIVVLDEKGGRIVADGLGYTNEIAFHPSGDWLYVNETFARRLSRFRLAAEGRLGPRETVTEFGAGTFPDGLTFDSEGGAWITSIVSNRVIRVDPEGRQGVMLEDSEDGHLAQVEAAYQAGEMARPHLDRIESKCLKNISSLAFGGPDLRTAYLGCLLGDSIASFRAPIAGQPPLHWKVAA